MNVGLTIDMEVPVAKELLRMYLKKLVSKESFELYTDQMYCEGDSVEAAFLAAGSAILNEAIVEAMKAYLKKE